MNYASLRRMDLSNGPGVRSSIFVSGCKFHCPDCFNGAVQDFSYGKPYTDSTALELLKEIAKPHNSGLSILGGEPLWQNIDGMADLENLCHVTHKLDKTVWMWTGFTWEELMTPPPHPDATWLMRRELVTCCDVLVDGRFEKDLKDPTLLWAGSTNQRVIDVQKSLAAGQVILHTEKD